MVPEAEIERSQAPWEQSIGTKCPPAAQKADREGASLEGVHTQSVEEGRVMESVTRKRLQNWTREVRGEGLEGTLSIEAEKMKASAWDNSDFAGMASSETRSESWQSEPTILVERIELAIGLKEEEGKRELKSNKLDATAMHAEEQPAGVAEEGIEGGCATEKPGTWISSEDRLVKDRGDLTARAGEEGRVAGERWPVAQRVARAVRRPSVDDRRSLSIAI